MSDPSGIAWLPIHYRTAREFDNPRWLSAIKAVRVLIGITTFFEPPSERRRIRQKSQHDDLGWHARECDCYQCAPSKVATEEMGL